MAKKVEELGGFFFKPATKDQRNLISNKVKVSVVFVDGPIPGTRWSTIASMLRLVPPLLDAVTGIKSIKRIRSKEYVHIFFIKKDITETPYLIVPALRVNAESLKRQMKNAISNLQGKRAFNIVTATKEAVKAAKLYV